MARVRDEAARRRQIEQDRILVDNIETEAGIQETQIQAQEEAEERESRSVGNISENAQSARNRTIGTP